MKLFYSQQNPQQNDPSHDRSYSFSNSLNQWMWPQLAPDLFGPHSFESGPSSPGNSILFVGTGTLLNSKLPERTTSAKKVLIFSAGAGYEQPLKAIPDSWDIYCVRGPLSAKQLHLPESMAITDSALLISQLFSTESERKGCSFMPHVCHADEADGSWQRICQQANIRYIDPRWPIEKVLAAISASERLISETIYGAITADALRVPWIPIATSPRIYSFKWHDWCDSMNLFYHPYRLPSLKSYKPWNSDLRSGGMAIRHWMGAALEGPVSTHQYGLFADEDAIAQRLKNIAKQAPMLSDSAVFERKLDQLQTCLAQLCHQYSRSAVMQ